MNFDLVIVDGEQAGRRLPVAGTPTIFGRATNAALSFPQDGYMSSNHLMVQAGPQGVHLTDLHSSNGTFLNGQRITQAVAVAGDTIQLGTLKVLVQPAVETLPPSAVSSAPNLPPAPEPPRQGLPPALPPTPPQPVASAAPIVRRDSGTVILPMLDRQMFMKAVAQPPAEEAPQPEPAIPLPPAALHFPGDPIRERVMEILSGSGQPLYCLLDAAVDPGIPRELSKLGIDPLPYSLYSGDSATTLASWAPYLFPLFPASPLLRLLIERGWGNAWASYFTTGASFEDLRKHFRRFLMVQVEGKGEVYFRFYDPRVLRDFLPTANAQELAMFFGPVQHWYLEGESPESLVCFWNSPEGLMRRATPLAP